MRFVVTCYLVDQQKCEFIVYGSTQHEAVRTFERTLQTANPIRDHIDLSDGRQIDLKSILAYRIDTQEPLF